MRKILLALFCVASVSVFAQKGENVPKIEVAQENEKATLIQQPRNFFTTAPISELPFYDNKAELEGKIVPKDGAETSAGLSAKRQRKLDYLNSAGRSSTSVDPLKDEGFEAIRETATRAPLTAFEGLGLNVSPPDPSMAVGPNHIVTMENGQWAVYDKQGNIAPGFPRPLTNPLQAPGSTANAGDPVVMYDREADRWFISQFQLPGNNVFLIGVSQTPDPTGAYNVFEYELAAGNDYPHYGVWGDSYVTAGNFTGAQKVYTFNRAKMLAGDPTAEIVGFSPSSLQSSGFAAPIPVHSEAAGVATGDIKIVFYQDDAFPGVANGNDHIGLWNIDMDWTNATTIANSTISPKIEIPTTAFDAAIAGGFANIAQPNTNQRIDAIVGAVMNMSHWYKFPTYESILLNWVVEVTDGSQISGIRWVELRSTDGGNNWSIFQEGTFTDPTGNESVFMGCMSMDMQGNIGLGYTKSGTTTFPSLYYTGRTPTDPLGTMSFAEDLAFEGTNSITSNDRYGDYGQGVRDPSDDMTFWVTSEYSGDLGGDRRVGIYSFRLAADLENDVAIINISQPVNDVDLTTSETVEIIVQNLGSETVSDIPVTYSLDGGATVSATIAGPLAFGELTTFSFTPTVDLGTNGLYEICATVASPGDENSTNNTFCKTVVNFDCLPGSTTGGCNIDGIKRFILGDINADDGGNSCNTENSGGIIGYSDRTDLSTELDRSAGLNTHTLQAQSNYDPEDFGATLFDILSVWVDFNDNGTFEASEQLINGESFTSADELNDFTLTIPTGSLLGPHILRAKSFDPEAAGSATNPCSTVQFGEVQDYIVIITDSLLACDTSTTYTIAEGWSNNAPTSDTTAIIAEDYDTTLQGDIVACELTVEAGAILTVRDDNYINIVNDIVIDGTLIVENAGSIVQIEDDAITTNNGTIEVRKTTPSLGGRDFTLLSSPMIGETRSGVYQNAHRAFEIIPSLFTPHPDVTTAINFIDVDFDYFAQATTLNSGQGFMVFPQAPNATGSVTLDHIYTLSTLNSGTINYALVYNGVTANNFNLVGNPYASAIDTDMLLTNNDAINEVYFWEHLTPPSADNPGDNSVNHSMDDVSIYNLMGGIAAVNGGTAPERYMASGQGFGILADQSQAPIGSPLTFTNAMRVTDNNGTVRSAEIEKDRLWLELTSTNDELQKSTTLIGFTANGSPELDAGYDSKRIDATINIFSTTQDGEQLGIQTRESFDTAMEIGIGFDTKIDESETYTIGLAQIEGSSLNSADILLIDNALGTVINLKETDYTFSASQGIQESRFTLVFESNVLSTDVAGANSGISIYPNPASTQITISTSRTSILQIELLDILGRIVQKVGERDGSNKYELNITALQKGVYFTRITTMEGTIITEEFIKK